MYKVNVQVEKVRESDTGSVGVTVESKSGEAWVRDSYSDVSPGTSGAKRTFLLNDDQRVIVEGCLRTEVVYDAAQNAAVLRFVDPVKAVEDQTERRRIALEAQAVDVENNRRLRAAEEAERAKVVRTNLGNPVLEGATVKQTVADKPMFTATTQHKPANAPKKG